MSHPNVELVRRGAEAINARELPEGLVTADVRMENVSTAVTEKTYLGAAGVRDWMNDFFDAFGEGARYEVEEIVAVGDDFVVAVNRFVGSGLRSGAPLVLRFPSVTWIRDGRIARAVGYATRRKALEAAGLGE